jgi:hypothetical protein
MGFPTIKSSSNPPDRGDILSRSGRLVALAYLLSSADIDLSLRFC